MGPSDSEVGIGGTGVDSAGSDAGGVGSGPAVDGVGTDVCVSMDKGRMHSG